MRQDPHFEIDKRWFSNDVLRATQDKIKKTENKAIKAQLRFELASVTAQQGQLVDALQQMASITDFDLKQSTDFLEERAEIKSLLGFDTSALEDMDRIKNNDQSWKALWHRSLILERAGKNQESRVIFRNALAEAERFRLGDNYLRILLETAKQRQLTPMEPSTELAEKAVSIVQSLLNCASAPPLKDTITLLGLDEKSIKASTSGENHYAPLSKDSPIKVATITADGNQVRIYLDTAHCQIAPNFVRQHFDAASQKELWPGSNPSEPSTQQVLFAKKTDSAVAQFSFDAASKPALNLFFISFKQKP